MLKLKNISKSLKLKKIKNLNNINLNFKDNELDSLIIGEYELLL